MQTHALRNDPLSIVRGERFAVVPIGTTATMGYFAIRRFARFWAIVVNTAFNWLASCTL